MVFCIAELLADYVCAEPAGIGRYALGSTDGFQFSVKTLGHLMNLVL